MATINVGFIGLSSSGWASVSHGPYLFNTAKYKIVALCNSTRESAEAAKKHWKLSEDVQTYGSPEELAEDKNVQLVVSSVRVDSHAKTIRPSLEAGKDAFVEWPLEANLEKAIELHEIAKAKGVRTMIGLQGRKSPVVSEVKKLLANGRIETERVKYFADSTVGGNMLSIHFAHVMDFVLYTLGPIDNLQSRIANQRPQIGITRDGKIVETMTKDTHDHVMLNAQLSSGASWSFYMRGGGPFKGEPGFLWRIYGEKGEIQVTASRSMLNIGLDDMTINVHDHTRDTVETIDWRLSVKEAERSPNPSHNIGKLYEAFADNTEYATWEDAIVLHSLLDKLYKGSA